MIEGLTFDEARAIVASWPTDRVAQWYAWQEGWDDWRPVQDIVGMMEPIYRPLNTNHPEVPEGGGEAMHPQAKKAKPKAPAIPETPDPDAGVETSLNMIKNLIETDSEEKERLKPKSSEDADMGDSGQISISKNVEEHYDVTQDEMTASHMIQMPSDSEGETPKEHTQVHEPSLKVVEEDLDPEVHEIHEIEESIEDEPEPTPEKSLTKTAKNSKAEDFEDVFEPLQEEAGKKEFIVRRFKRYKKRMPVTIECDGQLFGTHTVDVSLGGLFVEDPLPEWVAGYFKVRITQPGTKQQVELTCCLIENQSPGARYRLQLLPLQSADDETRLEKWLAA